MDAPNDMLEFKPYFWEPLATFLQNGRSEAASMFSVQTLYQKNPRGDAVLPCLIPMQTQVVQRRICLLLSGFFLNCGMTIARGLTGHGRLAFALRAAVPIRGPL
jgi:hypothetical protein